MPQLFEKLTFRKESSEGRDHDFSARRQSAQRRLLVEISGKSARLDRHKVSTDAVDDRLKNGQASVGGDHQVQNVSAQPEKNNFQSFSAIFW